jgi:hypothetical protein
VARQAPTEAAVRELREMLTARYGLDEELVALCDSWLAQRDEIERLQVLHLRRTKDTDHDLRELLDEVAALRDVVAAARAYLDVPRRMKQTDDGVYAADFKPQQEAYKRLAAAVAAVVSWRDL